MADGYRFPQQSAGNYYYPQQQQHHHPQPHHPRHQITRNTTPPNSVRPGFNSDTPSPNRSPNSRSPAPGLYGMFNQGHQGQHGRVNGGPNNRGAMHQMMFNFQQQNSHQQHQQHHPNLQQDHNSQNTNGLNHHSNYSSGVLSNATPSFTPSNLQSGLSTTRGGQAQAINEHWAEQLKQHKESEKIHQTMIEQGQPNHYARLKANENKLSTVPATNPSNGDEHNDDKYRHRMADTAASKRRQEWYSLDISGQGLRNLALALFHNYEFLKELYIPSNKLVRLPVEIGQLRSLVHLDASNNLLTEVPPELGMCTLLENLLLFDNNLRTLPYELGHLHNLQLLGIEGNKELDRNLREMIMEKGTVHLITHLRETAPIPLPPAPRAILDLQDGGLPSPNQERFKVFSMNILSNSSCTTKAYGHSPAAVLSWDYRKEKIMQEIEGQDADIVCLQEVEREAFEEFFSVKLAYTGYKGVFTSRSRAKTMQDKDKKLVDGCAIFYKYRKYILLDKQDSDLGNIAINRPDMKNQDDIFNRIMPRDHIGVLAFLENRVTGSRLMVGTTHIYWDPKSADVKLIQIALFMSSISKWAEKWSMWPACTNKKTYGLTDADTEGEAVPEYAPSKEYTMTSLPLLICADLNSTSESGVYELLAKGSVKPDHPEIVGFKYGDFTTHGIDHPFQLRSAYSNIEKSRDAIPFTNYTATYKAVIDHIWYSTNALENTALLGGIDPEYMKKVPGFPNYHFPSDHVALMAEFVVKGTKEKKARAEPDFGPSSSRRDRRD